MAKGAEGVQRTGLGATMRRDAWWVEPASVAVALGLFGIYATWAALQGKNYFADPYLSPFYSPLILLDWWPWSPAILILWAPLGFRATCYYYRKAYYRAYFLDPPACSVGESSKRKYCGETTFPFIMQNLHRYFLYAATVVLAFLWYDVIVAFNFDGHFGMGIGTLVLIANSFLLTMYTLSCHSVRHIFGGKLNCFATCSGGETRYKIWHRLSGFNTDHMFWAWVSLIMVGFADFYVRMVASGVIADLRIF
jgi:hypothetical protein